MVALVRRNVLITGANGFLGSWLARALAERGDGVRCLVRGASDRSLLEGVPGLEIAAGDVTDAASLDAAMPGVDLVYHLAGIRRALSLEAFMRVNADGTRLVCDALARARGRSGPRRLILA